jgi:fermentation-respiration switch protein FrsA (DUF1100 family)
VVSAIIAEKDSTKAIINTTKVLEKWIKNKSKEVLEEMSLATTAKRKEYVEAMVSQLRSPWFSYFISFDPTKYLEQLRSKVLALNGDMDIQVISKQNLPAIRAALKRSSTKNYEVKELAGLNHFFQSCKKCTLREYGELEESFSPVALNIISDWLNKNTR